MGQVDARPQADDLLAEQAAGWVARLTSSDATDLDRQSFEAWYRANPDNALAFDEMNVLWGQMARVPKSVAGRRHVPAKSAAVLCLLGLCLLAADRSGLLLRWQADHYTGVGMTQCITLDDGSVVTLNTDSAVDVEYDGTARRIVLLRGEAFFDVTPDPGRPFTVEASGVRATALGTHYGVRLGAHTNVMVEEGRVAVSTNSQREELGGGEAAFVGANGEVERAAADVDAMTSWRGGKLVFSGQPLGEVLAEIDRYRPGRIVSMGNVSQVAVSGVFDIEDTNQAIASLEKGLGLDVIRLSEWLTVVRAADAEK